MKEFNNKIKEITDMILNKTLESNEVSNMEVNLTPVYDETRQAEIVFGLDNRVVRVEISGAKEIFGTVTVEIDHISHSRDLEDFEQVLNNLDKFENPSREEVEEMKTKWREESNKRFEKELLKDIEGSNE